MKKTLAIITLSAILLIISVISVSAYDFKSDSGINNIAPTLGYSVDSDMPVEYYIGKVLGIIFSFTGLIFLVLIIYAGINWMTAQGNTSQIDKAKNTIVKAIVGLVICISAYAITYFVVNIFEKTPQTRNVIK